MRYFFLLVFSAMAFQTTAQTRTDLIFRLDKTSFSAIVDEIGEADIIYYLPKDTAKRTVQKLDKKQVWKIVYENGETELINNPVAPSVVKQQQQQPAATAISPDLDRIFLRDKTMLTGKVIKVSADKIEYRKQETGPVYELDKKQLTRIVYAGGQEEDFGKIIAEKKEVVQSEPTDTAPKRENVVSTSSSKTNPLQKLSATVGFEAGYLLGSKDWTDKEEGIGLQTAMGANLRINYQVIKPVAAYMVIGYSSSSVKRNYMSGSETEATEKYSLVGLNAGLGVKYFVTESIFILGEGKANFLKLKGTYTEDGEEDSDQLSSVCPSFKAGVGFTKKFSRIVLEADVHFQVIKTKFDDLNKPIQMAGIRLGIGLSDLFKK